MNATVNTIDTNEMLKSATIYRNSAFNYIYVCFHCERSFPNIENTLEHLESHFDTDQDDDGPFSDDATEFMRKPQCFAANTKSGSELLVDEEASSPMYDDNGPVEMQFECAFVEEDECEDGESDLSESTFKFDAIQCHVCGQKFESEQILIIHLMQQHSSVTTLTCPHCSQNWKSETKFMRHLQQHIDMDDTTYGSLVDKVMSKCKVTASTLNEQHNKSKQQRKPSVLTCDICWSTFSTRDAILLHLKESHFTAPEAKKLLFDCDKCERKIEGRFPFYAHQYAHITDDDRINDSDDECLQQGLRKYLDDNIICDESKSDKSYSCNLCSTVSVTQRRSAECHILQRHIYLIKRKIVKNKQCEYCGKEFTKTDSLESHKRTHSKEPIERPYICNICHKSYADPNILRQHVKLHSDITHTCNTCQKSFKSVSRLNRHRRTHLNDLTKCTICSKELKSYRMKIHIKDVHESDHRPFRCSVCSESFKTSKTLRQHSLRHNSEKKFKCRFSCQQTFTSAAGRRAHERTKHETNCKSK